MLQTGTADVYLLTVLEAGKLEIQVPADTALGENPLSVLQRTLSSLYPSTAERESSGAKHTMSKSWWDY